MSPSNPDTDMGEVYPVTGPSVLWTKRSVTPEVEGDPGPKR